MKIVLNSIQNIWWSNDYHKFIIFINLILLIIYIEMLGRLLIESIFDYKSMNVIMCLCLNKMKSKFTYCNFEKINHYILKIF